MLANTDLGKLITASLWAASCCFNASITDETVWAYLKPSLVKAITWPGISAWGVLLAKYWPLNDYSGFHTRTGRPGYCGKHVGAWHWCTATS